MSVSTDAVGGFGFYILQNECERLTELYEQELGDSGLNHWLIQQIPESVRNDYDCLEVCEYDNPQGVILIVIDTLAEECLLGKRGIPDMAPLRDLRAKYMIKFHNKEPELLHGVYEF